MNSDEQLNKEALQTLEKIYCMEVIADKLIKERDTFESLNKQMTETIYRYHRNTNLGFYIFLSTALFSLVYLLK